VEPKDDGVHRSGGRYFFVASDDSYFIDFHGFPVAVAVAGST
jgi:hypothetical protein